jgi:hypothetical protein
MVRRSVSMSFLLTFVLAATGCPIAIPDSGGARYTPAQQAPNLAAAQGQAILDRAVAVRAAADEAVKTDGSPKAIEAKNVIGTCKAPRATCMTAFEEARQQVSATGALAGMSYYLTQPLAAITSRTARRTILKDATGKVLYTSPPPPPPELGPILAASQDLALAESYAQQATDEAKKNAEARDAQKAVLDAEVSALNDARKICDQNQAACRTRCDKEPMYCLAVAGVLWDTKPRKLVDAKTFTQRACDGKVQTACVFIAEIDREIQQVEGAWRQVVEIGDDLVQKHFVAEKASKMSNGARMQRQLATVQAINQAIVVEKYCPTRKGFLQVASVAEFQKRAAAHCKDEAPTGQGLSGADVTLTNQCSAVYAIPCP